MFTQAHIHAGALRASGPTVIDSPDRLNWAAALLTARGVDIVEHSEVRLPDAAADAHTSEYLQGLAALAVAGGGSLDPELRFDAGLWQAAKAAAATVCHQTEQALHDRRHRLCLSRPGSHHAGPGYALGGCVLNNLAIAAQVALRAGARKVAVVDFDAHHGNGTQDIFWSDGRVLCASMHQHPFFPGTGGEDETGAGIGIGATFNVPLAAGAGTRAAVAAYARCMEQVREFAPELVLLQAGLDGHVADWTTDLKFRARAFRIIGELTARTLAQLDAPGVFELGGGYTERAVTDGLGSLLDGLGTGQ